MLSGGKRRSEPAKGFSEPENQAMSCLMKEKFRNRISINPSVCFGKPCIRGHRIWVSLILDMLTEGMTIEEILAEYPQLEREDILACLAYGAEMSRERYVEIPTSQRA